MRYMRSHLHLVHLCNTPCRDPIDYVKKLLVDNNLATAEELKAVEKDIRNDVQLRYAHI